MQIWQTFSVTVNKVFDKWDSAVAIFETIACYDMVINIMVTSQKFIFY